MACLSTSDTESCSGRCSPDLVDGRRSRTRGSGYEGYVRIQKKGMMDGMVSRQGSSIASESSPLDLNAKETTIRALATGKEKKRQLAAFQIPYPI